MLNKNELEPANKDSLPAEVLSAFQTGTNWAYEAIHKQYNSAILSYVIRRVGDLEASKELVQEVFLKTFRFRNLYRPQYAFVSWLWSIARNVVNDWAKKGKLDKIGRKPNEDVFRIEDHIACTLPNPEAALNEKANQKVFRQFLKQLSTKQRRVIWMRLLHHLSYEEIADTLGLSITAVKCIIYRCRQTIKKCAAP